MSKQDHYDWGFRAVKSVLVVAGGLKRSDRQRTENQVLMRALRDFNVPKIVTTDMEIFMGLIGDQNLRLLFDSRFTIWVCNWGIPIDLF